MGAGCSSSAANAKKKKMKKKNEGEPPVLATDIESKLNKIGNHEDKIVDVEEVDKVTSRNNINNNKAIGNEMKVSSQLESNKDIINKNENENNIGKDDEDNQKSTKSNISQLFDEIMMDEFPSMMPKNKEETLSKLTIPGMNFDDDDDNIINNNNNNNNNNSNINISSEKLDNHYDGEYDGDDGIKEGNGPLSHWAIRFIEIIDFDTGNIEKFKSDLEFAWDSSILSFLKKKSLSEEEFVADVEFCVASLHKITSKYLMNVVAACEDEIRKNTAASDVGKAGEMEISRSTRIVKDEFKKKGFSLASLRSLVNSCATQYLKICHDKLLQSSSTNTSNSNNSSNLLSLVILSKYSKSRSATTKGYNLLHSPVLNRLLMIILSNLVGDVNALISADEVHSRLCAFNDSVLELLDIDLNLNLNSHDSENNNSSSGDNNNRLNIPVWFDTNIRTTLFYMRLLRKGQRKLKMFIRREKPLPDAIAFISHILLSSKSKSVPKLTPLKIFPYFIKSGESSHPSTSKILKRLPREAGEGHGPRKELYSIVSNGFANVWGEPKKIQNATVSGEEGRPFLSLDGISAKQANQTMSAGNQIIIAGFGDTFDVGAGAMTFSIVNIDSNNNNSIRLRLDGVLTSDVPKGTKFLYRKKESPLFEYHSSSGSYWFHIPKGFPTAIGNSNQNGNNGNGTRMFGHGMSSSNIIKSIFQTSNNNITSGGGSNDSRPHSGNENRLSSDDNKRGSRASSNSALGWFSLFHKSPTQRISVHRNDSTDIDKENEGDNNWNDKDDHNNEGTMLSMNRIEMYRFVGWWMGSAVVNRVNISLNLATVIFNYFLNPNWQPNVSDLKNFDSEGVGSTINQVEMMKDKEFIQFLRDSDENDKMSKDEYFKMMCNEVLVKPVKDAILAMREGFFSVVEEREFLSFHFSIEDIHTLICGSSSLNDDESKDFDVEEIYQVVEDSEFHDSLNLRKVFWQVVAELTPKQKRLFCKFVTGIGKLPLPKTEVMRIEIPFTMIFHDDFERALMMLPAAHTCTNTLEIPNYESAFLKLNAHWSEESSMLKMKLKDKIKEKLLMAITDSEGYQLDTSANTVGDGEDDYIIKNKGNGDGDDDDEDEKEYDDLKIEDEDADNGISDRDIDDIDDDNSDKKKSKKTKEPVKKVKKKSRFLKTADSDDSDDDMRDILGMPKKGNINSNSKKNTKVNIVDYDHAGDDIPVLQ